MRSSSRTETSLSWFWAVSRPVGSNPTSGVGIRVAGLYVGQAVTATVCSQRQTVYAAALNSLRAVTTAEETSAQLLL
jgi:hypothetical protein